MARRKQYPRLVLQRLFTSDGTARIPLMHYNGAGDGLKSVEGMQDNASTISVFVLSELATGSIRGSLQTRYHIAEDIHEESISFTLVHICLDIPHLSAPADKMRRKTRL
jgi:hypothetical protein